MTNTSDPDQEIKKLKKINAALMGYVERSTDQQGNAYSLFQTAINLESLVRRRTEELTTTLHSLEQTNSELKQAKDSAENANLSKTRFLAAASHDLLQPLNAAHLLMSSLTELQHSTEAEALANQVERSLETIDELLRSLLDISRLDAGVVQPDIENIDITELFESLESDFRPLAKQRDIHLIFRPTCRRVMSDRSMLRRVLQNIIANAISYTNDGKVLVGVRHRGDQTRIDVLDTGIGIAEEQSADIFEEFHRGIPPGNHQDELSAGLGLGLAIVARMVKTLEHQLKFQSIPGRGTWFKLYVPTAMNRSSSTKRVTKSADVSRIQGVLGTRVLLIENDSAVLQAMNALLTRWHCKVQTARNMDEAIERLKQSKWTPDIIIADQHLDNGDLGTATIEAARRHVDKQVPAIIITADPSEVLNATTTRHNIELMHKPVKPAQLRALLAHVLS